jgi:pentatricopeptide repeat protein
MGKVDHLYGVAQNILSLLHEDKTAMLDGWAAIENSMIIAKGHAGDGPSADAHRLRLLEQGMTPTADAYGALIQCIKDTTDDTARALEFFHESQTRGVQPNIFLYNTTISKLAKARKADYALELFQNMKKSGVVPSSITYGAVIAACCRVGDSASAETLFEEMTSQRNFRPRVPPYNTMMQFYVQTKPNRDRFLHYYNRMLSAGIKPTAHSYKLLLDCHGTIAPVDIKAMEKTFSQLVKDKTVTVQGSHWAALINAHGCVGRDLDKAITVFNSIEKHPNTVASGLQLPDAVTFEALINVLVTLRRTDLVPEYLDRLRHSGVHMTAYIANLLIRGCAAAGDIEQARSVFESLADPPVGVAAPNNHAPHHVAAPPRISRNELVYREPSTWEAMVRAELGNSNRDHAIALIKRVQERQYPESIVNRISGIMLDDAVSPWPSASSSEVDAFVSSRSHSP